MRATHNLQKQRQWQMKPQVVSTTQSVDCGSCSMHRFSHTDIMRLWLVTSRVLEHNMQNRRAHMSARNFQMAHDVMQHIAKAYAANLHWQINEMYWNTTQSAKIIFCPNHLSHTQRSSWKSYAVTMAHVGYYTLKTVPRSSASWSHSMSFYSITNSQHNRAFWSPPLWIWPKAFGFHSFPSSRQHVSNSVIRVCAR